MLHAVAMIKDEYIQEINIEDCTTTTQIIQDGKVVKEATGLSVLVELEPKN